MNIQQTKKAIKRKGGYWFALIGAIAQFFSMFDIGMATLFAALAGFIVGYYYGYRILLLPFNKRGFKKTLIIGCLGSLMAFVLGAFFTATFGSISKLLSAFSWLGLLTLPYKIIALTFTEVIFFGFLFAWWAALLVGILGAISLFCIKHWCDLRRKRR